MFYVRYSTPKLPDYIFHAIFAKLHTKYGDQMSVHFAQLTKLCSVHTGYRANQYPKRYRSLFVRGQGTKLFVHFQLVPRIRLCDALKPFPSFVFIA
jgi:hypothetical protein